MYYHLNYNQYQSIFVVPTSVVDNHLKLCGAVQLKTLLLILRGGDKNYTPQELATAMGLSAGDVWDA